MFKSVLLCGELAALRSLRRHLILFDLASDSAIKKIEIINYFITDMCRFGRFLFIGTDLFVQALDLRTRELVPIPQFDSELKGPARKLGVCQEGGRVHLFCANDRAESVNHLELTSFFGSNGFGFDPQAASKSEKRVSKKQYDYLKNLHESINKLTKSISKAKKIELDASEPDANGLSQPSQRDTGKTQLESNLQKFHVEHTAMLLSEFRIEDTYCKFYVDPELSQLRSRIWDDQKLLNQYKQTSQLLIEQLKKNQAQLQNAQEQVQRLQRQNREYQGQLKAHDNSLESLRHKTRQLESDNDALRIKFNETVRQKQAEHTRNIKHLLGKAKKQEASKLSELTAIYRVKLDEQCQRMQERLDLLRQEKTRLEAVVESRAKQRGQADQLEQLKQQLKRDYEMFKQRESLKILHVELHKIKQRQRQFCSNLNGDAKASIFRELRCLAHLLSSGKRARWADTVLDLICSQSDSFAEQSGPVDALTGLANEAELSLSQASDGFGALGNLSPSTIDQPESISSQVKVGNYIRLG